ncbi:hypothetical protein GYA27_04400, partial [candidate division WWE3 bacterium]|nr:hypothetical protein [candidate division WWE3 bacterium]
MEKIISLSDSIKKSIVQIFRNDLLGFWVKGKLYTLLAGVVFFIPLMIAIFSIIRKVSSIYSQNGTVVPPTPNLEFGAFVIIMLITGGLALAIYGVMYLNFCTLLALKVANGTTEPLKPVLILSFKRVWPMFVHMVVKGFILLIGFLLFIIPG